MTLEERIGRWLSPGWTVFAKRLSANDTGATGGHQSGLYLPDRLVRSLYPALLRSRDKNPRQPLTVTFNDGPDTFVRVNVIWYNNGVVSNGTRDECRITGWGGSNSPLMDPDQTGALLLMAFERGPDAPRGCEAWLCSAFESEIAQSVLGEVEPTNPLVLVDGTERSTEQTGPCDARLEALPPSWLQQFPSTLEIARLAVDAFPGAKPDVDARLMSRRECEYRVFRLLERHHVLPIIQGGFDTIGRFIEMAHSVANRRKARAGRSLEHHLCAIFDETEVSYTCNGVTEGAKRPDFVFPSIEAYRNPRFPADQLRTLAAKTTCKDRWRQILNEADRLKGGCRHLLTLQEGVSVSQFEEMVAEGVQLVVPKSLWRAYPQSVRPRMQTLEDFVAEVGTLAAP